MAGSYQLGCIGWLVWIVSAGSYWLYCIEWILLAGLYLIDCISIGLGFARRNWLLYSGWFANCWMGWINWMGGWWNGDGMEGLTLAGSRMGATQLAPERERHQWLLRDGCKGAEYLCWRSKIIQIDCTQIGTNL